MTNDFYNHDDGYPAFGATGTSAAMRAQFDKIMAGFDKMPTMTGNGNKLMRVNAAGTALEVFTAWIDATTYNVTTTYPGLVPKLSGNPGDSLRGDGSWSSTSTTGMTRVARTSNTPLSISDTGKIIDIVSGTFTQTFNGAATLGISWFVWLMNSGTGDITLDPNASELIDGLTSYIMYPGEARLILCDGSTFTSFVMKGFAKNFLTSGTFVKPPGYKRFSGKAWAAGGGRATTTMQYNSVPVNPGAGGACVPFDYDSSALTASTVVTLGAGGTPGVAGGNTTFHTTTAYGGDHSGGFGGGALSNGASGGQPAKFTDGVTFVDAEFGGGRPGSGTGSNSVYGGAGAPTTAAAGNRSIYGGGSGSADNPNGISSGGDSVFGGDGGRGGYPLQRINAQQLTDLSAAQANFSGNVVSGDLGIIVIASSHSTDGTPATPTGWVQAATANGGQGVFGTNSGNRRVTVFTRTMDGSETTVSLVNGGFTDCVVSHYIARNSDATTPTYVAATGTDNTAGTSWSITTGSIDVQPDDFMIVFNVHNSSVTPQSSTTAAFSLAGATFGEIVPNGQLLVSVLNLTYSWNWSSRITSGTATAALTFTATMTSTSGDQPAGAAVVLRLRGYGFPLNGVQPGGGCGGLGQRGGNGQLTIIGEV